MDRRCRELIATDESAFVAEAFLDSIVVENGQGNAGFPDPSSTDESDRKKTLSQIDQLPD